MGAAGRIGAAVAGLTAAAALLRCRPQHTGNSAVHELGSVLPLCRDLHRSLSAIETLFVTSVGFPAAVLIPEGDRLTVLHHTPGFALNPRDLAAAGSALRTKTIERQITEPGAETCYVIPLTTWKGVVGIFTFKSGAPISRDKWKLIHWFAHHTSLAILRCARADEANDASVPSETDRFQQVLINSIAHNVKTPLASIIGVLSTLQEDQASLDSNIRADLVETARHEADRLHRLLSNLLDFSRIESGAVQVRADPCDVQDVIGAALEQLGATVRNRSIQVRMDSELPLIRMDFVLIVQVLVNMLDNAVKYSAAETPIDIEAHLVDGALEFRVLDRGSGIPEGDLVHVFDKFNRAGRNGESGGIGLGLSICRGLIEAHRGTIWAERRSAGGTAVAFRLPLDAAQKGRLA